MNRAFAMIMFLVGWAMVLGGCEQQAAQPTTQPAVAIEKAVERGPVKLVIRLDKDQIVAGERLPMLLEVAAPRDVDVQMPALGDALGQFEVLDPQTPPDIPVGGGGEQRRLTHRYNLRTLEAGEQVLPPITIKFSDRRVTDGSSEPIESELTTPELTVTVSTSVVGEFDPTKFRDIKDAVEVDVPRRGWRWWWIAAAIAVGALMLALGRRLHRATPKLAAVEPPLLPHLWANRELDRLAADGLVARGQIQPFFFRLSDIVRQYIERRFSIMAAEQTTEEFLREARRNPSLDQQQQRSLGEFLRGADMVKFAKYQPDPSDCDAAMASARQFVYQTAQQQEPASTPAEVAA